MSKKFLVFLIIWGLALPCYAAVQNVRVGGDINTLGFSRYGFNLEDDRTDAQGLAAITNLRVLVEFTENVSLAMGLCDERIWGIADRSELYLSTAFVDIKEFLDPTVNLMIGRMPLRLGDGLIVGDPDTNQMAAITTPFDFELADLSPRKAFTGAVAIVDVAPLKITTGGVKAVEGDLDIAGDDVNVYVIHTAYDTGLNAVGELYYVLADTKKADVNNFGLRLVALPVENLSASGELVYQARKGLRADRKHASDLAMLYTVNYAFPELVGVPSVGLLYLRASDKWSPMAEDFTAGDIANALFPLTNQRAWGANFSVKPVEDVTLRLNYTHLRLVSRVTALGNPDTWGAYLTTGKKHLGDEIDLKVTYDYTEDVQFGLVVGYFMSGEAFTGAFNRNAAQAICSMKVVF